MKNLIVSVLVLTMFFAGCATSKKSSEKEPEPDTSLRYQIQTQGHVAVIYFALNSANVDLQSESVLDNSAVLQAISKAKVIVIGHADARGTDVYNMNLSKKRADAAKAYLEYLGVKEENIAVEYYGKRQLADPANHDLNRRVEIILLNRDGQVITSDETGAPITFSVTISTNAKN